MLTIPPNLMLGIDIDWEFRNRPPTATEADDFLALLQQVRKVGSVCIHPL